MTKTMDIKAILLGSAAATLLAMPPSIAHAQEQTSQDQAQQSQTAEGDQSGGSDSASQQQAGGDASGSQGQTPAADQLVATVGEAEIRGGDVLTVIGLLPEPMRAQPPELLVPMAVDQLVFRELILQQALEQNLGEDPEVRSMVEQSSSAAEEDALVQVWLRRELENAVTDEQVQQVYDQLTQTAGGEAPPLEQVRPQIEQHLRQQAVADIRQNLAEGVSIVLYDPSGNPVEMSAGGGQGQQQGGSGEGSGAGAGSSSAATGPVPAAETGPAQAAAMPKAPTTDPARRWTKRGRGREASSSGPRARFQKTRQG